MSIVLFYNEGFTSRLMFYDLMRDNPNLIDAIVEFPVIPSKKNQDKLNWRLVKKITSASMWFVSLNIIAYTLYAPIARLAGNDLRSVAIGKGIVYRRQNNVTRDFIAWLRIIDPDWILNGSSTIMRKDILSIPKSGVVNYHGVTLPDYRGTGNQFWLLKNGEKEFRPTLHHVEEGLDTGDIIDVGTPIKIAERTTVFTVWRDMLLGAPPMLSRAVPWFGSGENPKALKQNEENAVVRSFPKAADVAAVKRRGHSIITPREIIYIFRVALTGKV